MRSPESLLCVAAIAGLLFPMNAPAEPASAAETTVTGTIETITRSGGSGKVELGVLNGCGHALRVLKCAASSSTPTRSGGASIHPADLRPGWIVRVRYRPQPGEDVAVEIEVVSPGGGA